MNFKHLLDIRLNLFDGGGAAGGAGAGAAASGDGAPGTQGETKASPASTRRGKSGEYQNVIFGKQAKPAEAGEGGDPEGQQRSSDAGSDNKPDASTTSNTLEAKRRAFQDLVNGEYKDIYTEETQRIIDRRFRETRNLEQQVGQYQPVIDMLMQRYQIGDGDMGKLSQAIENDDAYWSEAAEEAGMSVEQYKQFQKLQRENEALLRQQRQRQNDQRAQQQLQQWYGEAEQVKGLYPSFDLNAEVKNPSSSPCSGRAFPSSTLMKWSTWTRSRRAWPPCRPRPRRSRWWTASAPRAQGPRKTARPPRVHLS